MSGTLIRRIAAGVTALERRVEAADLDRPGELQSLLADIGVAQKGAELRGLDEIAARLAAARERLYKRLSEVLPDTKGKEAGGGRPRKTPDSESEVSTPDPIPAPLKASVHRWRSDWRGVPEDEIDRAIEESVTKATPIRQKDRREKRAEFAKAKRAERRKEARAAALAEPAADDRIVCCRCSEMAAHVEAGSVDAVITDPPYGREHIPVYEELRDLALHSLKPGGLLLTFVGQAAVPDVFDILNGGGGLTYRWLVAYAEPEAEWRLAHAKTRIEVGWKPMLAFYRDGGLPARSSRDIVIAPKREATQTAVHKWGQNPGGMRMILEQWTDAGQTVLDPFCGGGSLLSAARGLGRRVLGCDIDQANVALTRAALAEAKEAA